jgi:hypothetical protein
MTTKMKKKKEVIGEIVKELSLQRIIIEGDRGR